MTGIRYIMVMLHGESISPQEHITYFEILNGRIQNFAEIVIDYHAFETGFGQHGNFACFFGIAGDNFETGSDVLCIFLCRSFFFRSIEISIETNNIDPLIAGITAQKFGFGADAGRRKTVQNIVYATFIA